jgi:hypothetical protein
VSLPRHLDDAEVLAPLVYDRDAPLQSSGAACSLGPLLVNRWAWAGLLLLAVQSLEDRPPFFDFGFMPCSKCVGCLLFAWERLNAVFRKRRQSKWARWCTRSGAVAAQFLLTLWHHRSVPNLPACELRLVLSIDFVRRHQMFIAMNRFKVIRGSEAAFENVWLSRDSHL